MRSPVQIDLVQIDKAQTHEAPETLPILILGGGFGGLFTALHLRNLHSGPIILIDQSWNFVFKPLLYELLSSEVKLEVICPRYDQLLHNSGINVSSG